MTDLNLYETLHKMNYVYLRRGLTEIRLEERFQGSFLTYTIYNQIESILNNYLHHKQEEWGFDFSPFTVMVGPFFESKRDIYVRVVPKDKKSTYKTLLFSGIYPEGLKEQELQESLINLKEKEYGDIVICALCSKEEYTDRPPTPSNGPLSSLACEVIWPPEGWTWKTDSGVIKLYCPDHVKINETA